MDTNQGWCDRRDGWSPKHQLRFRINGERTYIRRSRLKPQINRVINNIKRYRARVLQRSSNVSRYWLHSPIDVMSDQVDLPWKWYEHCQRTSSSLCWSFRGSWRAQELFQHRTCWSRDVKLVSQHHMQSFLGHWVIKIALTKRRVKRSFFKLKKKKISLGKSCQKQSFRVKCS